MIDVLKSSLFGYVEVVGWLTKVTIITLILVLWQIALLKFGDDWILPHEVWGVWILHPNIS